MSDFVGRLLGRRDMGAIRPLLPSRYEPVTPLADRRPAAEPRHRSATPLEPPSARDMTSPAGPAAPGSWPVAPVPAIAVAEPTQPITEPAVVRPPESEPTPEPEPTREPESAPDPEPEADGSTSLPEATPNRGTPAAIPSLPPESTAESTPARHTEPPDQPSHPDQPGRPDQPSRPPPRTVPARRADPTTATPAVAATSSTRPAAVSGAPRTGPAHVADGRAPAEQQTVHITIGRLEVRAITEPAPVPPKRARHRPPTLSLEEYLRRRAGGDRG